MGKSNLGRSAALALALGVLWTAAPQARGADLGAERAGPTTFPSLGPGAAAPATREADTDLGTVRLGTPAAGQPSEVPRQIPNRAVGSGRHVELGAPFESLSGGIALRPPYGLKPLRDSGKNEIVQFVPETKDKETPIEEANRWILVVSRRSFPTPQSLGNYKDERGTQQPGLSTNTLNALLKEFPGAKILRDGDPTNIGNHDCAVIIFRYTKGPDRRLAQHAIIQANDQLFYIVSMNTPARADDPPGGDESVEDAGERVAVDTFRAVLDSIVLLDRDKVYDDQVSRLVRTRSLFANLTERKLASAIIPQQWMRIKKDGKDIGYSYIIEEPDRKAGRDGLRVGVRTRVSDGGKAKLFPRVDSESWMYVSMDRRQEDWSTVSALDKDGKPKTADAPWTKATEFGWSDLKTTRHAVVRRNERKELVDDRGQVALDGEFKRGEVGDANQPWVNIKDDYKLTVQHIGSKGDMTPLNRPLPPFYLPQALGAMLPRLLPATEPKSYMVATYVSEAREVMLRYLDVLPERMVNLDGRSFRAVPITDRLGQEGSVTTHYVTTDGQYLGSDNKDTKIVIVPTDDRTLVGVWADANLTRPGEILQTGGNDGDTRVTPNPPAPRAGERTPAPTAPRAPALRPSGSGQPAK